MDIKSEFIIEADYDYDKFYNTIELVLCGGLKSGFGRNLDALNDVLRGDFGILQKNKINKIPTIIKITKSKKNLRPVLKNVIETAIESSSIYYDDSDLEPVSYYNNYKPKQNKIFVWATVKFE